MLCVRERDRDLDLERCRPNNGARPTWNFNTDISRHLRERLNTLEKKVRRKKQRYILEKIYTIFKPCAFCLYGDRPLGICRALLIVVDCRLCVRASGR